MTETETVTLQITDETVRETRYYGLSSPVLRALQVATQTLWRVYDDGWALEVTAPYRCCYLSLDTRRLCDEYSKTKQFPAQTLTLELFSTEAHEGYSLRQQRKVKPEVFEMRTAA